MQAREELDMNPAKEYNLALSGHAGSGKSSLINALIGVMDGSKGEVPQRNSMLSCVSLG